MLQIGTLLRATPECTPKTGSGWGSATPFFSKRVIFILFDMFIHLISRIIFRLQKRTEEHDAEIEKMCNHHYQGFIASVKHLLHVKTDATQLKSDVVKIDSDLRESASSCVSRANELVKTRRVEKNIAATIESLSNCLPVLQTFSKLSRQMKEKRYHPALKTLEQLEQTYLPRITQYRFAKKMHDQIPKLRSSIKEGMYEIEVALCQKVLEDFFFSIKY